MFSHLTIAHMFIYVHIYYFYNFSEDIWKYWSCPSLTIFGSSVLIYFRFFFKKVPKNSPLQRRFALLYGNIYNLTWNNLSLRGYALFKTSRLKNRMQSRVYRPASLSVQPPCCLISLYWFFTGLELNTSGCTTLWIIPLLTSRWGLITNGTLINTDRSNMININDLRVITCMNTVVCFPLVLYKSSVVLIWILE